MKIERKASRLGSPEFVGKALYFGMKHRFYICFLLLLAGVSCTKEMKQFPHVRPGDEAKSKGFIGRVAEVQEQNFARPEGDIEVTMDSLEFLGVSDIRINRTYDRNGVLLERKYWVEDRFEHWERFDYDSVYHKLRKYDFEEDGEPQLTGEYKYGENGKLAENQVFFGNGKMKQRLRYRYDRKGRLKYFGTMLVGTGASEKSKLSQYHEEFYYPDTGLRIVLRHFQDHLDKKSISISGKMIQENHYDEDGAYSKRIIHKYNALGALASKKEDNAQGEILRLTEYAYDNLGRKIEEALYERGDVLINLQVFRYDSMGNVVLHKTFGSPFGKGNETSLDPNGTPDFVSKYKYSYDAHGNWTRVEHYAKENYPTMLSIRKVVYHED